MKMVNSPCPTNAGAGPRGALFVFEGLDRSGKTTQAQRLSQYLETELKAQVRQIKFPDRSTTTGKIINDYLANNADMNDNAVHLIFAANRWEKREEMEALLKSGISLIVDRYSYSGVAFSAAKGNPHLDRDWCAAPERGLLAPDAVFFLDVDAAAANLREDYGAERYEEVTFQQVVRREFASLQDEHFHAVDAGRSIEAIHEDIKRIAAAVWQRCRAGSPLQELWGRAPSQLPSRGEAAELQRTAAPPARAAEGVLGGSNAANVTPLAAGKGVPAVGGRTAGDEENENVVR